MIQAFLQRLARIFDRPLFPWKQLVIGFSLGRFTFENWLLFRQYRVYQSKVCPKTLKSHVDNETFEKSQAYGRAKAKFSFASSIFGEIKNLTIICFDVMPKMWAWTGLLLARFAPERFSGEISHSLLFIFAFGLIDLVLDSPFSYYQTFHLEQKFGFNNSTLQLWITDIIKGQLLTIAFGIPLGSAFLSIVKNNADTFFYYLWVFMLFVQLAAITIYPIVIVPLFNKLSPLEPGALKDGVEALAQKLQFPLTELQVIDGSKRSSHSNAYFAGLPWKKKIVVYDTLLEKSTPKEVEAVLAHELGHWKSGHTWKLMLVGQSHLFYMFALFYVFIYNRSLYDSFGFRAERPVLIGFLLLNDILSPTDAFVKLGMNVVTRKFEYQADEFALNHGYSKDLANCLIKLQIQNLSSMDADWLYSSFHYSHPILTERLKAIGWKSSGKSEKSADSEKPVKAADREL